MLRLLNYEKKRLFNLKSFWIFLSVELFFSILSVVVLTFGDSLIDAIGGGMVVESEAVVDGIIKTPQLLGVEALLSGMGDSLITILPILIAIFITSEYSNGTYKNIISRGYSRYKVYFSKLLSSCFAATIIILSSVTIHTMLATYFWGFSDGTVAWGKLISVFLVKFISFFALISLSVFIAMTIRSTAGAVAVSMLSIRFFPLILSALETLRGQEIGTYSKYEVSSFITSLSDTVNISHADIWLTLIIAIIYIITTTGIGYYCFAKRDL